MGNPGVKAAVEVAIVPLMAAVANAIYDAVKVRMTSRPMNPAAIVKALEEKGGS